MLTFPIDSFDVKEGRTLIRPCYFITFNDVIDLKGSVIEGATEDEDVLYQGILGECQNDAYNIRLLVIDDIGREHASLSGWQKTYFIMCYAPDLIMDCLQLSLQTLSVRIG